MPVAALTRLRGTAGVPPLSTDERDKEKFVKNIKLWNTSCVVVLCSLTEMLSEEILSRIKASGLNVKTADKNNIQLILDWLNVVFFFFEKLLFS